MHRPRIALLSLTLAVLLGACGGASSASPAGPSPSPLSAEGAAQAVIASEPRFAALDLGPRDPEMIGGCCYYVTNDVADGYEVEVHVGWGDCPSGCINEHVWTYGVTRAGAVSLIGEAGDPVPAGELPPRGDVGG